MSMRERFPVREIERLSSYLDGALSNRQAARLEARLQLEPELVQSLEELRATRHLLSTLPELRPPRNFTLTPEMAGIREQRPIYPTLRLATALATLAFLCVVGVDAVTRGLIPLAGTGMKDISSQVEMAPAEYEAAAPEEDAMALPAAAEEPSEQTEDLLPPVPRAETQEGEPEAPLGAEYPPAVLAAEPTACPPCDACPTEEATPTPPVTEIAPTEAPEATDVAEGEPTPRTVLEDTPPQFLLVLLRAGEVAFGGAVVVLAVFMFRARRKT